MRLGRLEEVFGLTRHHLDVVSFLNDLSVEEVIGIDFVEGWELNVHGVRTVHYGCGQGGDEETLVHVVTSPTGNLVEGLEVLRAVEQTEKGKYLIAVLLVVDGEECTTLKHTIFVTVEELLSVDLENRRYEGKKK